MASHRGGRLSWVWTDRPVPGGAAIPRAGGGPASGRPGGGHGTQRPPAHPDGGQAGRLTSDEDTFSPAPKPCATTVSLGHLFWVKTVVALAIAGG